MEDSCNVELQGNLELPQGLYLLVALCIESVVHNLQGQIIDPETCWIRGALGRSMAIPTAFPFSSLLLRG